MPPPSSEVCFTPLSADTGKRAPGSASPSSPREQHSLLGHEGHYGSFQTGRSSSGKGFQAGSPPRKFGSVLDGTSESRPLSFWPLVALIFYTASGGPFGIEVRRRRGGLRLAALRDPFISQAEVVSPLRVSMRAESPVRHGLRVYRFRG